MVGPIPDITVLDLTVGIAGPYATKLLADYGADVIKVEPPGGDLSRSLGPFPGDIPHPEKSGTFAFFNTNKRSIVLDLKGAEGREAFWRLAATAHVVVESFRPGVLDRLELGWDELHRRIPGVSLVSISNFGQDSPYRDYRGTELTLYGFGGEMYTMGVAEREPVTMFGTAALVESGAAAATAILGAVMVSTRQGIAQHVDFSIVDSHFGGADRRHVGAIAFEFSGRKSPRQPADSRGILRGVYPCADGYVEFSGAGGRLDRVSRMLGDPEWLADGKWRVPGALLKPDLADEFEANFYPWLYEHTKREIWALAREARVLCGPLLTIEELVEDEHFRSRGFWAAVDHPALGAYEMPGRPFIMNASPWELRRPAPLLGEHTVELLIAAGYPADEARRLPSGAPVATA
jgi:crotonobetainyl-CoA:carnitine CoA-transferase CaiB-like acyl-CoA transferase